MAENFIKESTGVSSGAKFKVIGTGGRAKGTRKFVMVPEIRGKTGKRVYEWRAVRR